jgi:hypothetical protein
MRMYWNERWATNTGERGKTAFVHVLRVATIVAISWSYNSPASSEEYPPAPPIQSVTREENFAPLRTFLSNQGIEDVGSVRIVTVAYMDNAGKEKLIAFKLGGTVTEDPPRREGEFLIPDFGSRFVSAQCTVTASPASVTSCGPRYLGGTIYYRSCSFGTAP